MEIRLGPWEGRDRAVEREYVSVDSREKKSLNGKRARGREWSYALGIIQTRKEGLLVSWAGGEKGSRGGGRREEGREKGNWGCCFR